ncbi:MAG: TetR/AcrR family transcriptional regulator [Cyanobacteria bacterium J06621_8]
MSTSKNTPEHILNTAEQLFAENGYAGTSLRSIVKKAGVNLSAVSYHFGSKEDLYIAIVKRVAEPVDRKNKSILADYKKESNPISVEKILEAYLRAGFEAVFSNGDRSLQCAKFMGRCLTEPDFIRKKISEQFDPIEQDSLDELQKALPDKSRNDLNWKMDIVLAALLQILIQSPKNKGLTQGDIAEEIASTIQKMVDFFSPGMRT